MKKTRFSKQIQFIAEIDKLKTIKRLCWLLDGSRQENDAEHSWQLAVMAIVLCQHSNQEIDLLKVIKMLLIHDIVEIDAGDCSRYDTQARINKYSLEKKAAIRIFGLLPKKQAIEFKNLWEEYCEHKTPEANFASAIDKFQPVFHNHTNKGKPWDEYNISGKQIIDASKNISTGSEKIWQYAHELIKDAVKKGFIKK
ncbi:TPA: phosphohydrolase [Candidatus Dependentiae bacterium]|nr:phosphohydrolase [Candidatus Dependentiae bacterium]